MDAGLVLIAVPSMGQCHGTVWKFMVYGGVHKWGYPQSSSIYRWIFPYKPSILGYPHLWKPPYMLTLRVYWWSTWPQKWQLRGVGDTEGMLPAMTSPSVSENFTGQVLRILWGSRPLHPGTALWESRSEFSAAVPFPTGFRRKKNRGVIAIHSPEPYSWGSTILNLVVILKVLMLIMLIWYTVIHTSFRIYLILMTLIFCLVGGLVAMFYFPILLVAFHHPNWRTIFFRGVALAHQPVVLLGNLAGYPGTHVDQETLIWVKFARPRSQVFCMLGKFFSEPSTNLPKTIENKNPEFSVDLPIYLPSIHRSLDDQKTLWSFRFPQQFPGTRPRATLWPSEFSASSNSPQPQELSARFVPFSLSRTSGNRCVFRLQEMEKSIQCLTRFQNREVSSGSELQWKARPAWFASSEPCGCSEVGKFLGANQGDFPRFPQFFRMWMLVMGGHKTNIKPYKILIKILWFVIVEALSFVSNSCFWRCPCHKVFHVRILGLHFRSWW